MQQKGPYKKLCLLSNTPKFINAKSTKEIIFTSGATESISEVIYGYFKDKMIEGDEVLVTKSEHASIILPWFDLENKIGIKVNYIPLNEDYTFNTQKFIELAKPSDKNISETKIINNNSLFW